jgi:hypothetical protein
VLGAGTYARAVGDGCGDAVAGSDDPYEAGVGAAAGADAAASPAARRRD